MITKGEAYKLTKEAQIKVIEDLITAAAKETSFEAEILNLTDEEQKILEESGYKLTNIQTKQGKVWRINWQ